MTIITSACAYDLLQQPGVEQVTVADLKPDRVSRLLKSPGGRRLALSKLDLQDGAALRAALRGQDAVLNAAPYYFNLDVTRAAVGLGGHRAELGGNTGVVVQPRERDGEGRRGGGSVGPRCGRAAGGGGG